ncbi:MAG: alpha-glucosidase, partial [Paraburkholderia graminis]
MRSITNLKHPPRFALASHEGNRIVLASPANCRIELYVLAEDIIRVLVLPDGELHGPRTWAIAPGAEDVALEGRERRDMSGFAPPPFHVSNDGAQLVVQTACIRLRVTLNGGFCAWDILRDAEWHCVMNDRKTQAYNFGWWDERVYHYVERRKDE